MDCIFRVLSEDKKTFDELKDFASGYSEKGLLIINAKCDFFEILKNYNFEMLITPLSISGEVEDCFYFDGEMRECSDEIINKFDMSKYEPIIWKSDNFDDVPF